MGSRMMFRMQPDMVPMLAWRAEPSLRVIWACTTFRMAGMAPKDTVHSIYCPVAVMVVSSAPRTYIRGVRKTVHTSANSRPENSAPQKPKAEQLFTFS